MLFHSCFLPGQRLRWGLWLRLVIILDDGCLPAFPRSAEAEGEDPEYERATARDNKKTKHAEPSRAIFDLQKHPSGTNAYHLAWPSPGARVAAERRTCAAATAPYDSFV